MSEVQTRHQFQVKLAEEEHKYLVDTIRERLVQSVNKRRERLLKEKEQLDIGDSNALLLHPNQFSIANPASPGAGAKRATRHAGKRAGADPDEPSSILDKRKRRLYDETDGQSPAPVPSRMEYGGASPFRDGKSKNAYHQYEAPVYSVDRLFTEKELSMAMNTAAVAATNFLVRLRQNNEQNNGNNGAATAAVETEDGAAAGIANRPITDIEMEDAGTPAAADMERTQSYHATRGATRNLLNDLATAATRDIPFGSATPMYIPAVMGSKANSASATVPSATQSEIEQDLMIMHRETNYDDPYNNKLLERAAAAMPPVEYQYMPPAATQSNLEGPSGGLSSILGGIPMSAQNSVGGQSDAGFGDAPMSRTGSAFGGTSMKRTASSTSLLGVDGGRRGKARA